MLKLLPTLALCLLLLPAPLLAQSAGAKPNPLSSTDKSFLKNAGESLYFLSTITERTKRNAGSETVKELGEKMGKDLVSIWGEIGGIATSNGEMMPTELKGSDKTASQRLNNAKPDKFDHDYISLANKEAKKLTRHFESGAKMVNHPELKAAAEKWLPTVAGFEDQLEKAEKEIKGRK
jgi:predicted outer membrane protein